MNSPSNRLFRLFQQNSRNRKTSVSIEEFNRSLETKFGIRNDLGKIHERQIGPQKNPKPDPHLPVPLKKLEPVADPGKPIYIR